MLTQHDRLMLLDELPVVLAALDSGDNLEWLGGGLEPLLGWHPEQLVGQHVRALLPEWLPAGPAPDAGSAPGTPNSRSGGGARRSTYARGRDRSEVAVDVVTGAGASGCLLLVPRARPASDGEALGAGDPGLGAVAHELGNLLGVIANYSTLLSRQVSEPTAQADLGAIREAAERAAVLSRTIAQWPQRSGDEPGSGGGGRG